VNILNRKFYGIELGVNNLEQKELLSLNQRFNLEQDLKRILPSHFKQNRTGNMNPFHRYNDIITTRCTLTIDDQNNTNSCLSHQDRVGYAHNVTRVQHQEDKIGVDEKQVYFNNTTQHIDIPEREIRQDTNSFHENIWNNTMIASMTGNQNNYNNNGMLHNNGVGVHSIIPQQLIGSPGYNVNYNPNIRNNVMTAQIAPTTDINHNNGLPYNDHQDLNGVGDYYTHVTYPQQQDLNAFPQHISENDYTDRNTHSLNEYTEAASITDNQICESNRLVESQ
jgi:hypothetical protein